MLKKINQYLITHYPTIWNIRFVWMFALLFCLHLAFFIAGYFSFYKNVQLHDKNLFESYFELGFVWIGILLSVLVIIIWLNQYLKNNAFKQFYPKSVGSIFLEFILQFIIFFFSISFNFSYTEGLRFRIKHYISDEELNKELNIFNRASPFTLQNLYAYSNSQRNFPLTVLDTLVKQKDVMDAFKTNLINTKLYTNDSLQKLIKKEESNYYNLPEFDSLLFLKFPEIANYKHDNFSPYNTYNSSYVSTVDKSDYVRNNNNENSIILSLYNYDHTNFSSTKNEAFYRNLTHKLLQNKQKDSIQYWLDSYTKLLDKYNVSYFFKDKPWIDHFYNPPFYFLKNGLFSNYNYKLKPDYIEVIDLENTLDNLIEAKEIRKTYNLIEINVTLYLAICFTLLLFSFRFSSLKSWAISLVGLFVLSIIYGAILFTLNVIYNVNSESIPIIICLCFYLMFCLIFFFGKSLKISKSTIGIGMNWLILTIPVILPLLCLLYSSIIDYYNPYNYKYSENWKEKLYASHPLYKFIDLNFKWILIFNLVIIGLFVFILIPKIKNWKALPEE